MMKRAQIQDFHLLLVAHLTQYDMAVSAREAKRGRVNIYRLGLLLQAAERVEEKAKSFGIWARDDPNALAAYWNYLTQHFIYEEGARHGPPRFAIPNLRKLEKQIKAWTEERKLPKYPLARVA